MQKPEKKILWFHDGATAQLHSFNLSLFIPRTFWKDYFVQSINNSFFLVLNYQRKEKQFNSSSKLNLNDWMCYQSFNKQQTTKVFFWQPNLDCTHFSQTFCLKMNFIEIRFKEFSVEQRMQQHFLQRRTAPVSHWPTMWLNVKEHMCNTAAWRVLWWASRAASNSQSLPWCEQ